MLVAEAITGGYDEAEAMSDVTLYLGQGRVLALLGVNGAGKTTILRALCGLLPCWSGRIGIDGHDATRLSPARRLRLGVALVPEGRRLFPNMTVEENLVVGGHSNPDAVATLAETLERFPQLAERRRQRVGTLSGGEQQLVAVARALMAKPRYLLLDEPTLGLSYAATETVMALCRELADAGGGVLLAEQNVRAALQVCDSAALVGGGRVLTTRDRGGEGWDEMLAVAGSIAGIATDD